MKYIFTLLLISFMSAQAQMKYKIGDVFPEYELKSVDDKITNSEELKGKVVFLNAWFTTCKPCVEEMPELNKLQQKYKDEVVFISMSLNNKKEVLEFLNTHDYNFKHLIDAKDFLETTLGNKSYPKNIIIGKSGKIEYIANGLPYKRMQGSDKLTMFDYTFFEKPLKKIIAKDN